MSKNLKPLDRVRSYLERSHATNFNTIPVILASGETRAPKGVKAVFTAAGKNTFYQPELTGVGRNTLIRYRIPKDWHRRHVVENPQYRGLKVNKEYSYDLNYGDRRLYDVKNGGRVSTYKSPIPNEFIDEICFGPKGEYCYDPKVLQEHIVNESPDGSPDLWEWNYYEDFYPDYPEIFEKYGRK